MLPPFDSLQHQNLKLPEFISSSQTAQVPPPAYSATILATPALSEDQLAEEEEDDGYDHFSSPPAPITIRIDASLKIEGHANTVVFPQSSPLPTKPSSSLNLHTAMTGTQKGTAQSGRVERLTNMVLTTLKDAGLFKNSTGELDDQPPMRRPIDIHLDAGIRLKGSKNTVCSGLPKLIKATGGGAMKVNTGVNGLVVDARKRRACSVCVSLSPTD